ncbi:MAG: hypothetical protein GXC73_16320 [Chitinophagaceae bacterium]|nr:hypothetical protein [Chitinophagaceae bacterium]
MKRLFQILLLGVFVAGSSSATLQTKQQTFLQITDAGGQLIRGTSVQKFYERQIIATSFSGVTAGNAQVQFMMPSGGASATLANMQGSKETIPYAVFTNIVPAEPTWNVLSTVRLEAIRVISVQDANGSTSVTLQAERIGTTYYQNNLKTGIRTVSGKTGYDFKAGQTWNTF